MQKYLISDLKPNQFIGINNSRLQVVGCIKATIIFEHGKYEIMLRVVPNNTMQNSIILGRDFMKLSKLSISNNSEIIGLMNIDIMNISENITSAHKICNLTKIYRLR